MAVGALWLVLAVARAQELSGWVELRNSWQLGVDGRPWQLIGDVRPTFDLPIGRRVSFSITPELTLLGGRDTSVELRRTLEASDFGPLLDAAGCTWPDGTTYQTGIDAIEAHVSVERLYVDAYLPKVDVRVGRQPLQWGSGLMIHPTDPFDEVLFTEPWKQRRGVNAIRATVPLGPVEQIQGIVSLDDTFRKVRAAVRATANAGGFDVSVVGAYRQDDKQGLVGLDVKGTAGVGLWFEGALKLGGDDPFKMKWSESLVAGLDYSFPVLERIYLAGQYVRQGDGTLDTDDPAALASRLSAGGTAALPECGDVPVGDLFGAGASTGDASTSSFASPFAGRDYLLLTTSFGFIPELSLNLVDLQNLDDGTGVFVPTVSSSPTGWLNLSVSAQVPYKLWGDGGEFKPSASTTTISATPIPGLPALKADLGGLVPDAQLSVWARANF